MSVNSTQQQSASREWADTDGIDLSRYISTLWKRWPEIVLTTLAVILLTALAVWAFRLLTPRIYEAIATVAIVRTSTDVSLDERFTTEQQSLDVDSRRMALIALVSSGEIAQQVIDELGDALPTSLQDPAALLDTIESEMALAGGRAGQSDLINIKARTDSPQTSALIANTWAKAYVQQVNNIYGKVPDELLASVEAQLAEAQQTYEQAQSRLESYVAASQLDELLHQSDAISNTLGVLQSTQLDAITSENDRLRSQLRLYNDQWLRTTGLLTAARALGEQVSSETEADPASIALALQVLQVQMVNAAAAVPPVWYAPNLVLTQQPTELQLQMEGVTTTEPAALAAQVTATIASMEGQLVSLQENIVQTAQALNAAGVQQDGSSLPAASGAALSSTLASAPLATTIAELEEQRRMLQGQIEVENGMRTEALAQRDLAWESLVALNNKQAEMLLTRAAANSEVRLSSTAVPLDRPVEQASLAISLILAAVVGLLLSILLVFMLEVMNVRPLRSPRPAV